MSSFRPGSPPLPPPPSLPPAPAAPPAAAPCTKAESSAVAWVIDQAHTVAAKGMSWCADAYKKSVPHSDSFDAPFLALGALTVCVVGFDTLGFAPPSLLPSKVKAFVVNLWGFARPALATVGGADNNNKKLDSTQRLSSPLTSYWVSTAVLL